MSSTLSHGQKATYQSIFRHPIAHNIEWASVIPLFKHLGEVEDEANGKTRFSRNGMSLTFRVHGKNVEVDEVKRIRHFMKSSSSGSDLEETQPHDVLVVLDHSGARIFRIDAGQLKPEHIVPLDPAGHDQQVHNPQGDSGGKQGPHRKAFYEVLAKDLEQASRILMIGDGHGASSEVERFKTELSEAHHKDLLGRIAGTEVADISHMTEGDFYAKGRTCFSAVPAK